MNTYNVYIYIPIYIMGRYNSFEWCHRDVSRHASLHKTHVSSQDTRLQTCPDLRPLNIDTLYYYESSSYVLNK